MSDLLEQQQTLYEGEQDPDSTARFGYDRDVIALLESIAVGAQLHEENVLTCGLLQRKCQTIKDRCCSLQNQVTNIRETATSQVVVAKLDGSESTIRVRPCTGK